jgi:hypothetical protein
VAAELDVELPVWMVPRGVDLALLGRASLDEVEPPDLRVRIVARSDATLVAEVIEGVAPYDGDALMVVERRGAYEVLHRDVRAGEGTPCVRLTLAPWPRR